MTFEFKLPTRTVFGRQALKASEAKIRKLGAKALVVSGKHVTKSGLVKSLTDHLDAWQIGHVLFNDIVGEPTDVMIEAGTAVYKSEGCDFLIAIGGGSPLDSAKAIAAMAVLDGKICDYAGAEIEGDFPPMVLIPTTAGTGSEATKFTVITDTERGVKRLLKGDALIPDLAIIDPDHTISSPRQVTAATGMDALTHAVEAYTSRRANHLTDPYALDAIKRIFRWLPVAYNDAGNYTARENLSLAAYEAGICINNASVTLVHGMSRPVGALFHVPHGISNAMLIRNCLAFAMDGCIQRFADMARTVGAAEQTTDDPAAAKAFIDALGDLCESLGIPSLETYGINREQFHGRIDKMATDAMASGSPSNTIKTVTKDNIISIYRQLWAD